MSALLPHKASEMCVEWKLTLDGILTAVTTLVAAVVGFGAVLLQIRSSSKQLREQVADQYNTGIQEQQRQRRAVATAILFEIDDFYRYYLVDASKWQRIDPKKASIDDLPLFRSSETNPFPVYRSNAGALGGLGQYAVQLIVRFNGAAVSLIMSQRDYQTSLIRSLSIYQDTPNRRAAATNAERLARLWLDNARSALLRIVRLTYLACYELCEIAEVDFKTPRIAVAAETLLLKELKAEFEGQGTWS